MNESNDPKSRFLDAIEKKLGRKDANIIKQEIGDDTLFDFSYEVHNGMRDDFLKWFDKTEKRVIMNYLDEYSDD